MLDANPRDREAGGRLGLAGNRDGAPRDCIGGELPAVGLAAGKGEEQKSGADTPRIEVEPVDRERGKLRREWLRKPDAREYLAQGHRENWTRMRSPSCKTAPGAGLWPRAIPLPFGVTIRPFAAASASTVRMFLPTKFGAVGSAGCLAGTGAGAGRGPTNTCAVSADASSS